MRNLIYRATVLMEGYSSHSRRSASAWLWDAVEGLDEPDRTLFLRYYYYGDKLKDIARALGLTQTAAKQRLFRGRKALRDTLTKGGVEA